MSSIFVTHVDYLQGVDRKMLTLDRIVSLEISDAWQNKFNCVRHVCRPWPVAANVMSGGPD